MMSTVDKKKLDSSPDKSSFESFEMRHDYLMKMMRDSIICISCCLFSSAIIFNKPFEYVLCCLLPSHFAAYHLV